MPPAVWSFNPKTGLLKVMDDSLKFPNGVALSADGKTLYLTSTPVVLDVLPTLELDILFQR
jgi:sugar lactone lactonase YvrE